ncbi:AAA family ATPase [Acinetobacter piscicola]|uniref:AAA family ATPase n=1 Tax=Acinetobacter piscicola TaxID=2006115 RepID=UPI001020A196|nr:AAA family ATPase [Acinetobacter piscicola]RYL25929.1 ATP-binding cassette domain-containing protein [Acinetobacter piscicola]
MKIKSFEVHGLFGFEDKITLNFNEDLNILSGRNGAGKTTVLKLMWYLISGNFDKAAAEIKFKNAKIITDEYDLQVEINLNDQENPLFSKIVFSRKNQDIRVDEKFIQFGKENPRIDWFVTQYVGSSFFFPTFRMIEGGFTTEKYDIKHDVLKEFYLKINNNEGGLVKLDESLKEISQSLNNKEHNFITSISANNIENLLVKKYASIITTVSDSQNKLVDKYTEKFKILEETENDNIRENLIEDLDKKNSEIQKLKSEIDLIRLPINQIENIVDIFFSNKSIIFGGKIRFIPKKLKQEFLTSGSEISLNQLLSINNLSAGEKQILNFITYNAIYDNTIIFIDEPELSLHADWQRILFRKLQQQNPTNQFIISTHSPFIYSKYPDKEICIDPKLDRGNVEDQK